MYLAGEGTLLLYTILRVFLLLARGGGGIFRVVFNDPGIVEFVGPVQEGG